MVLSQANGGSSPPYKDDSPGLSIGMGSGSRPGKMEQHWEGKPVVEPERCIGCGSCVRICAHGGPAVKDGKASIDHLIQTVGPVIRENIQRAKERKLASAAKQG